MRNKPCAGTDPFTLFAPSPNWHLFRAPRISGGGYLWEASRVALAETSRKTLHSAGCFRVGPDLVRLQLGF